MGRSIFKKSMVLMVCIAMVFTFFTVVASAQSEETDKITRLGGDNRYETAAKIALSEYDQADKVILVRGDVLFDGLTSNALAGVLDAPILLTEPGKLHDKTAEVIDLLDAKNVVIIGGTAAVATTVSDQLESTGLNVKRITGENRYETAANVAREISEQLGTSFGDQAFIVSGSAGPDALVIGPYAAANGIPILLVKHDNVPAATTAVINDLGISEITVIGGSAVVSDSVMESLGASRVYGENRYETSFRVAKEYYAWPDKIIFASGEDDNLVDAMAGSYLGARLDAPILYSYSGNLSELISGYFDSIITERSKAFILGGTDTLGETVIDEINKLVDTYDGSRCGPFLLTGELPGGDTLGRGYDVFDTYADPANIKLRSILDYARLYQDEQIEEIKIEKSEFETISGTSVETYLRDMSKSFNLGGTYKFFSASVKQSFTESHLSSSEHHFATVQYRIYKTGVYINLDEDDLKEYLSPHFEKDINNDSKSPSELFDKYGTHVMTEVKLGGRLDHSFSANASKAQTGTTIAQAANASYAGKFGADAGLDYDKKIDYSESYTDSSYKTITIGGCSELGADIHKEGNHEKWIASIADSPALCGFYKNGLVPIWKLAESTEREDEIKEAFKTWAEDREYSGTFKQDVYTVNHYEVGFTTHSGQGDKDIFTKNGRITYVDLDIKMKTDGKQLIVDIVNLTVEEGQKKHSEYSGSTRWTFDLPVDGQVTDLMGNKKYNWNRKIITDKRHDWVKLGNGILVKIDGKGDSGPFIGVKFHEVRVPYTYTPDPE